MMIMNETTELFWQNKARMVTKSTKMYSLANAPKRDLPVKF